MRVSPAPVRSRVSSALFGLSCVLAALCPAHAQILYYDADGGIIASDVSGSDILIGSVNAAPFNVTIADGAVTNFNNDFNDSVFGVDVRNQAQIAMTGGSVNALQLRDSSRLSQSGGIVTNISAGASSSVSLSGSANLGSLIALEQTRLDIAGGVLQDAQLYGDARLTQTGGEIVRGAFQESAQASLTGGVVGSLTAQDSSQVTVSGGAGSGDWLALSSGQIIVQGSSLSVGSENAQIRYDSSGLYSGRYATLTGNLADGNGVLRTLYYGDATGDATQITLTGAERAPDFYAVTDQTASGLISSATIAVNDANGVSPTVTFDAVAIVGRLDVRDASVAQIDGATFYGDVSVHDNALARVTGGSIDSIIGYDDSAAEISGGIIREIALFGYASGSLSGGAAEFWRGHENSVSNVSGSATVGFLLLDGEAAANISGGIVRQSSLSQDATITVSGGLVENEIALHDRSKLTWSGGTVNAASVLDASEMTVTGSGLSTTGGASTTLWNGSDLYSGAYYGVSGTLTDGTALTNAGRFFAGNVLGGATQITFTGTERAPDLYLTTDGAASGLHSVIYVGRSADFVTQTSPTVTVDSAAHFGRLETLNASRIAFNGGKAEGFIVAADRSSVDVTSGEVGGLQTLGSSRATVTGGSIGTSYFQGNSAVGIGGGILPYLAVYENGTANITGGQLGLGPDGGLYFLSGRLNLFGTDITLTDGEETFYGPTHGIRYALTGTLLSGDALNTHLFLADGANPLINPGNSQDNPYLPGAAVNGVFTFSAVPSGLWFDPPLVSSYDFAMIDGGLFTDVLAFPTGFSGAFGVEVGGILLGSFTAGQSLKFADFGFTGGVSGFRITGIAPPPDAEDPRGFPLRLAFDRPFGSFTLRGIASTAPEPGTMALFAMALIPGAALLRRR